MVESRPSGSFWQHRLKFDQLEDNLEDPAETGSARCKPALATLSGAGFFIWTVFNQTIYFWRNI
ncbi:MAG: hypothetical protein KDE62_07660, partial [Calditrichaeota bacterium]|nr:hypothetical protein [Calditrichota bacterium]